MNAIIKIIPAHYLPALVNADETGLSDHECEILAEFQAMLNRAGYYGQPATYTGPEFTTENDLDYTAGDCVTAEFQAMTPRDQILANPDKIKIDLFFGPAGGHGFRRGNWQYTLQHGETGEFFASIPHEMALDDQRAILQDQLKAHCLAGGRVTVKPARDNSNE